MRGRMKLTGIIAVVLVVALGIGLTFRMLDTPAGADADKAATSTEENETASLSGIAETMAFFQDAVDKYAVDTIEIDGYTYGVLENGETFGPAYFGTEYIPDWVTAEALDGTHKWHHDADMRDLPWPNSPTEVQEAAAHPVTYTIPRTYVAPGGEVYEYEDVTIGGVDIYDNTGAKYIIITLNDGSKVELAWADYKADPSILDQYDMKYLVTSNLPLKALQAIGWDEPFTEEEWADPEGKYEIFLLADGSLADAPLAEFNADPDSFYSQYDVVAQHASKSSLAELEELGVADLLFPDYNTDYPDYIF